MPSLLPQISGLVAEEKIERLKQFQPGDEIARAMLALDAGRVGTWMHDIVNDEVWGDRYAADLLGLDFHAQPWSTKDVTPIIHPDDRDKVLAAVEQAYEGVTPYYDVELRRNPLPDATADTEEFWIGSRAQVTERDANGNPLRIIGVNWDISAIKRSERRLEMLAAEMDHRVKNAFAVIRAMINVGAERYPEASVFASTLRSQVEAMATAHMLSARMARQNKEDGACVAIRDVIQTALGPWLHVRHDDISAVQITDKANVRLQPGKVAAFAMMVYELSTNASKHGALGKRRGNLSVAVDRIGPETVMMTWSENFAGPLTSAEESSADQGFGEMLLAHCARNLAAQVDRKLTETGLTIVVTFPASVENDGSRSQA